MIPGLNETGNINNYWTLLNITKVKSRWVGTEEIDFDDNHDIRQRLLGGIKSFDQQCSLGI